jgi:hypothetical protein
MYQHVSNPVERWRHVLGQADVATVLKYVIARAQQYCASYGQEGLEPFQAIVASIEDGEFQPLHVPAWLVRGVAITAGERAAHFAADVFRGNAVHGADAQGHVEALSNAVAVIEGVPQDDEQDISEAIEQDDVEPANAIKQLFESVERKKLSLEDINERLKGLCAFAVLQIASRSGALTAFSWLYDCRMLSDDLTYRDILEHVRDTQHPLSTLGADALNQWRSALEEIYGNGDVQEATQLIKNASAVAVACETWQLLPDTDDTKGYWEILTASGCVGQHRRELGRYLSFGEILSQSRLILKAKDPDRAIIAHFLDRCATLSIEAGWRVPDQSIPYYEIVGQQLKALGFTNAAETLAAMEDAAFVWSLQNCERLAKEFAEARAVDAQLLARLASQIRAYSKTQALWRYPFTSEAENASLRHHIEKEIARSVFCDAPAPLRTVFRQRLRHYIELGTFSGDTLTILQNIDAALAPHVTRDTQSLKRSQEHGAEHASKRGKRDPERGL